MNMEWTTYGHDWTALESLYVDSTYFKERYTFSKTTTGEWSTIYTSPANTVRYNQRTPYDYGLIDDKVINYIIPVGYNVDFAETVIKNGVEIYGFRDATTPSHYLLNLIKEDEDGDYFCLHCGVDVTGVSFCVINSSSVPNALDLSSLITAYIGTNNSYGEKYVVQPLVALDKKTPFYMIAGNTTVLEPFTVAYVQDKKFMIVANGICVEVD